MTKRHFAVVVKSVIMKHNKALCLLRSEKEIRESRLNSIDSWDLPGGGLQYFETLNDGLIREIREETSLNVKIIKPLNAHDIIKPQLHIVFITYLSEYIDGEVRLSSEHKSFTWLEKSEINGALPQKWLKRLLLEAFDEYALYKDNEKSDFDI